MEKHQEEWRDLPKGLKNILKIPDLPQKLDSPPLECWCLSSARFAL
jgi:hypothetical protein